VRTYVSALPPSRQQHVARKLERIIPTMLKRAERLAASRARKGDADYCRRHTTRH